MEVYRSAKPSAGRAATKQDKHRASILWATKSGRQGASIAVGFKEGRQVARHKADGPSSAECEGRLWAWTNWPTSNAAAAPLGLTQGTAITDTTTITRDRNGRRTV